jgi:hypothetical protein
MSDKDEEANIIERDLEAKNREGTKELSNIISDMARLSYGIRDQLKSDQGFYSEVDEAFKKNQGLLGKQTIDF